MKRYNLLCVLWSIIVTVVGSYSLINAFPANYIVTQKMAVALSVGILLYFIFLFWIMFVGHWIIGRLVKK